MNFFENYKLLSENSDKFERFYKKLVETNEKFNLTSVTLKEEVAVKHFVDSLNGAELLGVDKTVCEVGSGAGFPSLPIAVKWGDLYFTLFESNNKKC